MVTLIEKDAYHQLFDSFTVAYLWNFVFGAGKN